jgi:hypothetical protein
MKAVIKTKNSYLETEYYTDLGTFVRNIYNPEVRLFASVEHAERFLREIQKTSNHYPMWKNAKVVGIKFVEV